MNNPTKWRFPKYESLKKLKTNLSSFYSWMLSSSVGNPILSHDRTKKYAWNDKLSPSRLKNVEIILV